MAIAREKIWDGMERVANLLNLEFFIKMATLHENPRFHVKSKVKGTVRVIVYDMRIHTNNYIHIIHASRLSYTCH